MIIHCPRCIVHNTPPGAWTAIGGWNIRVRFTAVLRARLRCSVCGYVFWCANPLAIEAGRAISVPPPLPTEPEVITRSVRQRKTGGGFESISAIASRHGRKKKR